MTTNNGDVTVVIYIQVIDIEQYKFFLSSSFSCGRIVYRSKSLQEANCHVEMFNIIYESLIYLNKSYFINLS